MPSFVKSRDTAVIGMVVIGLITVVVVAINSGWLASQFRPGGRTLEAQFADTAQLRANDPVRIDGVTIGRVDDIELDDGGRSATVTMTIEDRAYPIHADARAAIRFRTLLGGNFAVTLERGTRGAGPIGSRPIPLARTSKQVEIEGLIGFARDDAKRGTKQLLVELPRALQDPTVLATASGQLRRSSPGVAKAVSAVRGRRERDIPPIIAATESTVRALDTPSDDLRTVVEGAAVTLATTARREADLRTVLDRGGAIQPRVRSTLARLSSTLDLAEPLVNRLRTPAGDIAPTLKELQPTLIEADRLLTAARPLVRDLRPAVRSLAAASRSGRRFVADVEPGLGRIANRTLPDLAKVDEVTKLATYEAVGPTIASLNASASTFDGRGHLFRFPALGGQRAVASFLPCTTWFFDPTSDQAITCQSLSEALEDYATYNPLLPTNP